MQEPYLGILYQDFGDLAFFGTPLQTPNTCQENQSLDDKLLNWNSTRPLQLFAHMNQQMYC